MSQEEIKNLKEKCQRQTVLLLQIKEKYTKLRDEFQKAFDTQTPIEVSVYRCGENAAVMTNLFDEIDKAVK